MDQQVVVFKLADEHYGINITAVDSIIELQAITVVPQAPVFVEGVIRLRGNLLPVVDLRKRFGILKVKKNLIILLDFGKVLNQNEFFQALKIESIPS
jgi:chemotaxis signal transduction protein